MRIEVRIKKVITIVVLSFFSVMSYAQKSHDGLNLYLNLGMKYVPIDYNAGVLIGLTLDSETSKLAYNLRGDMVFGVSNFQNISQNSYQISEFTTFNYLDIDYKIKNNFRVTAGFGWIYGGFGDNIKLNSTSGYAVGTVAVKYKVAWLNLELRGDIPLETKTQQVTLQHVYPLSLAFVYQFIPKYK